MDGLAEAKFEIFTQRLSFIVFVANLLKKEKKELTTSFKCKI